MSAKFPRGGGGANPFSAIRLTWEENSTEKNTRMQGPFLSHTSKLNQQNQWDVVSKSTAKIYPSNKYNVFPSFIIDQSWNTLITT